ncbi:MAG: hypothetical protein M0R40_10095 [Firmicutes bacterium]|nr:hypothetical protein [Bacillota bacterium]
MAFLRDDFGIIDVAFVFMLCAFVGGLGVLKVVTHDDWKLKVSKLENPANDRKETN